MDLYNGTTGRSIGPDEVEYEKDPYVAWLDERACENGIFSSRSYRGALSSLDLGRELRKPVRNHL